MNLPEKIINKALNVTDSLVTTQDEVNATLTNRLVSDNQSGSFLAAAVRPIMSFIYTALFVGVISIGLYTGALAYFEAAMMVAAIAGSIVNFYFTGRNKLKIIESQNKTALKITEMKLKHDQKMDRKSLRKMKRQNDTSN